MTVAWDTCSTSAVSSIVNPPKESQLHRARLTLVQGCQAIERAIESQPVYERRRRGRSVGLVERVPGLAAAALGGTVPPRVIHENTAHELRGNRKEVRPVLPAHLTLIHQLEIRLVHQCGPLQRVAASLVPQASFR